MVRHRLVTLFVAAAVVVAPAICAQELSPEEVQQLLERRLYSHPSFVSGEIIVKMMPAATTFSTSDLGLLGVEVSKERTSGGEIVYRLPTAISATLSSTEINERTIRVASEMSQRTGVEYAQPNFFLEISSTVPNDPLYSEQWHYHNNGTSSGESPGGIGLPEAWDNGTGDGSITVAVVDTGILPNHPDIAGSPNLGQGYDMISYASIANDGDGRDNDPTDPGDAIAPGECYPGSPGRPNSWHGTHVAGIVGVAQGNNSAGIAGVNWNVTMLPVRVLGKCGGTTVDINDGIRWAAGLNVPGVPQNPTPANVINLSLGSPPGSPCSNSPSTQAAIDDAVAAGAIVVVAAGNDAVDAAGVFPASCNNVITVAASDARGHLVNRYSNFGNTIEIMAPGGDVQRDDDGDGNNDGVLSSVSGGYQRYNGTSMAAPHVAGVIALWLFQDPTLTPSTILQELQSAALGRTSSQCPNPCGAGLLSAVRSSGPIIKLEITGELPLKKGETAGVDAWVSDLDGNPIPGISLTFSVSDPTLAALSANNATTDANGFAQVKLEGKTRLRRNVQVKAEAGTSQKTVDVELPTISLSGVIGLAGTLWILLTVIALMARKRTGEP